MRTLIVLSTLLAAALLAAAAPAAGAAELQTWQLSGRSVDGDALKVNVLLPDGYDGRRRFPVLYLLHGHGGGYGDWVDPARGDAVKILAGLGAIVVMPEGRDGWYADWWSAGRRSPAWERHHLEELVPAVERRLRILPGRRWHAIAGNSMGGLGAAYYAAQRPGYFGALAVFSGVVSIRRPEWPIAFDTQGESHEDVYGSPVVQAFNWQGHDPTTLAPSLRHTRVLLTHGDGVPRTLDELTSPVGSISERELALHGADFAAALSEARSDLTYQPRAGVHDWAYWREHLAAMVRWKPFEPVVDSAAHWSFTTTARRSAAWGLCATLENEPGGLVTLSRDNDRLVASGAGTLRIRRGARGRAVIARLPFSIPYPRAGKRKRSGTRYDCGRTRR